MNPKPESTRRTFLKSAAPLIVTAGALGRDATPPSDRVTVGIIGSGGRAVFETRQYPSFDNTVIVAVCDAQESRRLSAKETLERQYAEQRPGNPNRGIRMYGDFRELLAQKDIDAVYIASPDLWHVSMLIPAFESRQARSLREAAGRQHRTGFGGAEGRAQVEEGVPVWRRVALQRGDPARGSNWF